MSTAQLRKFVDQCTTKERSWLKEYLITDGQSVPRIKLSKREEAELSRRIADIEAGRNSVRFASGEALAGWLDRKKR